jgi:hypothetical protein
MVMVLIVDLWSKTQKHQKIIFINLSKSQQRNRRATKSGKLIFYRKKAFSNNGKRNFGQSRRRFLGRLKKSFLSKTFKDPSIDTVVRICNTARV